MPPGEESLEPHPQGGSWTHPRQQMLSDILETVVSPGPRGRGEEATHKQGPATVIPMENKKMGPCCMF